MYRVSLILAAAAGSTLRVCRGRYREVLKLEDLDSRSMQGQESRRKVVLLVRYCSLSCQGTAEPPQRLPL